MMFRPLVIIALCGAAAFTALAATPGTTGPVVLELFTSETCATCNAADTLMERWAMTPNVIVLTEPVDYLDNATWKDPFASPLFSTRQLDYATALHNKEVPTPQVIVNGEKAFEATDVRTIDLAISAASRTPRVPVTLKWTRNQACVRARNCSNVAMTVGTLPPSSHKSDILLAIVENRLESSVPTNPSVKFRHVNIVRLMMRIADVDPAKPGEYSAETYLNVRPEWVRSNLQVVVFVQDRENRHVLGAASLAGFGR